MLRCSLPSTEGQRYEKNSKRIIICLIFWIFYSKKLEILTKFFGELLCNVSGSWNILDLVLQIFFVFAKFRHFVTILQGMPVGIGDVESEEMVRKWGNVEEWRKKQRKNNEKWMKNLLHKPGQRWVRVKKDSQNFPKAWEFSSRASGRSLRGVRRKFTEPLEKDYEASVENLRSACWKFRV